MAGFVTDASVTLTWCFEDEATAWTDHLLQRLRAGEEALVAAHWPMEVSNALLMAIRRGRITDDKVRRFFDDIRSLPIKIDSESTAQAFHRAFALAQQHRLTSYDAAYLEVAVRVNLPLATLDDELRNAAIAEGVLLPRAPSDLPS
jgi:predicted nucleic acid-binding protein